MVAHWQISVTSSSTLLCFLSQTACSNSSCYYCLHAMLCRRCMIWTCCSARQARQLTDLIVHDAEPKIVCTPQLQRMTAIDYTRPTYQAG